MNSIKIIEVTPINILDMGVLCGNELRFSQGKMKKAQWFRDRYEEGLRIKISQDENDVKTGMIEFVPGEYTWRTLNAKNYTVIHCLQVLRNQTRSGYGTALLKECIKDSQSTNGIAIVTSSKPWVNDKKFFVKNGFKNIDTAPPYFELLIKQFKDVSLPSFNNGWEERALKYGDGVTVLFSDQCPIIDYAIKNIEEAAKECNMVIKFIKIESYSAAQNASSPYGTFCIVLNGKFLTHRIFDKVRYVGVLKSGAPI